MFALSEPNTTCSYLGVTREWGDVWVKPLCPAEASPAEGLSQTSLLCAAAAATSKHQLSREPELQPPPACGVRAARALCGFQQLEIRVTAWYRPWGATQAGKSAVVPSSCWLCVQIYIAGLQFISHEHVSPKHLPLSCFQTPWEFSHGHAGKWCLILMVQVQGWSNGKQINF